MDQLAILQALESQEFIEKQQLVDYVKNYCKEIGVVLTIKKSKVFVFKCGQYVAKKESTTNSSSRLTGCTYVSLTNGSLISLEDIHLQWRVDIEVGMQIEINRLEVDEIQEVTPRKRLFGEHHFRVFLQET